jgi:hypothetical protein
VVAGEGWVIAAAGPPFTLVYQTQHSPSHKTPRLVPDSAAFGVRFSTASRYWLGKQNDWSNELIVMLDWVGKTKSQLGEIFYGFHRFVISSLTYVNKRRNDKG